MRRSKQILEELDGQQAEWSRRLSHTRNGQDVTEMKALLMAGIQKIDDLIANVSMPVDDVYTAWWMKGRYQNLVSQCDVVLRSLAQECAEQPNVADLVSMVWIDQPLS